MPLNPLAASTRYRIALIAAILSATILTGCATKAPPLPAPAEFSKPLSQLRQEYPGLFDYERSIGHWTSMILLSPAVGTTWADPFLDKWGEPASRRLSWWSLKPFHVVPPLHPLSVWRWNLGDKSVTAMVDHPWTHGWQPVIMSLEFEGP